MEKILFQIKSFNLNNSSLMLIVSTCLLMMWAYSMKPPPKPSKSISSVNARSVVRETIFGHLQPLPPPPSGYKILPMLLSHSNSPIKCPLPDEYLNSWKSSSAKKRRRMTLVLDLDETLVHASSNPTDPFRLHGGEKLPYDLRLVVKKNMDAAANGSNMKEIYVWKRPFLSVFLREMSKLYEIVIFTAGQRRYASPLIDEIDELGVVRRRYFRDACVLSAGNLMTGNKYKKDLKSVVSSEYWPERTILIDNSPCAYEDTCPHNALPIESYYGNNSKDNDLLALIPFLTSLSTVNDVRSVLSLRTNPMNAHVHFLNAKLRNEKSGCGESGLLALSQENDLSSSIINKSNCQALEAISSPSSSPSSSPHSTPLSSPITKACCEEEGKLLNKVSTFSLLTSRTISRSRDKGAPPSPAWQLTQQQQYIGDIDEDPITPVMNHSTFPDISFNMTAPSSDGSGSSSSSRSGMRISSGGRARSEKMIDKSDTHKLTPFLFRRRMGGEHSK